MSEEEIKAIEILRLSPIFRGRKPENDCLEIVLKLIDKLQKVIDIMAEELTEITGSCPLDRYDWENKKCDNCANTYKECFIDYYTKKAEEEK